MPVTEDILAKLIAGEQYSPEWPIGQGGYNEIEQHFGDLLKRFQSSSVMHCIINQSGGLGTYLGLLCYPKSIARTDPFYEAMPRDARYLVEGLHVYISLYAPLATYGQTEFSFFANGYGLNPLQPDDVLRVSSPSLLILEQEVVQILQSNDIEILSREICSTVLPEHLRAFECLEAIHPKYYLHGLFCSDD